MTGVTTIVKVCVADKEPSPLSVAVIVISAPTSPSNGVPVNVLPVKVNQLGKSELVSVIVSPSTSSVVIA